LWFFPVFLASLLAALATAYQVHVLPPRLESRTLGYGTASTTVLLDSERSPLRDVDRDIEPLAVRAQFYAALMASDRLRAAVARRLDVPKDAVGINIGSNEDPEARVSALSPEIRANALTFEGARYRLLVQATGGLPLVEIDSLAGSKEQAARSASAAGEALVAEIERRQRQVADDAADRNGTTPSVLGTPIGSDVTKGLSMVMAAAVFLLAFVGLTLFVLALDNLVSGLRRDGLEPRGDG
jgi:hypothetical protein